RRPEQAEELALADLEVERAQRRVTAVALGDAAEGDRARLLRGHGVQPQDSRGTSVTGIVSSRLSPFSTCMASTRSAAAALPTSVGWYATAVREGSSPSAK